MPIVGLARLADVENLLEAELIFPLECLTRHLVVMIDCYNQRIERSSHTIHNQQRLGEYLEETSYYSISGTSANIHAYS